MHESPPQVRAANTDPISPFIHKQQNNKKFELNSYGANCTARKLKNTQYLDSCSDLYSSSDAIS